MEYVVETLEIIKTVQNLVDVQRKKRATVCELSDSLSSCFKKPEVRWVAIIMIIVVVWCGFYGWKPECGSATAVAVSISATTTTTTSSSSSSYVVGGR